MPSDAFAALGLFLLRYGNASAKTASEKHIIGNITISFPRAL